MIVLNVLCAQLTRDLFAIAKFFLVFIKPTECADYTLDAYSSRDLT